MERIYFWFFPNTVLTEYSKNLNKLNHIELPLLKSNSYPVKNHENPSKTQDSTPRSSRIPTSSMHDSSSLYSRTDPKGIELQTQALRKLKLFPIFGDQALAKFSINYFLYLEFFHMGIRTFGSLWIFFLDYVYTLLSDQNL